MSTHSDASTHRDAVARASREERLAIAKRSPATVAAHDKAAWLGMFSRDAVVEDPVGTPPNRKGVHCRPGRSREDELGEFYETFISPNDIRFEVARDIVCGSEVIRDVVLHITMRTGLRVAVPAYVIYRLVDEDGAIRVARLAAHWEPAGMTAQVLRGGPKGWKTLLASSGRMLSIQGLRATMAYFDGTRARLGARGPAVLHAFADAVSGRRLHDLGALFATDHAIVELADRARVAPKELLDELGTGAELRLHDVRCAGWTAACTFELQSPRHAPSGACGIAIFELAPESLRLVRARLLWDDAAPLCVTAPE